MERATFIPPAGPATRHAVGAPRRRRLVNLVDTAVNWLERRRQRRALLRLDDRLLRDMGLSRYDVLRETDKPFWRP